METKDCLFMERVSAVIVIGNEIFEGDDHQWCLESATKHFSLNGYDLTHEDDLSEAISYTDHAFRNGELFGFDVFYDGKEEWCVSHYPNALNPATGCYDLIREYVKEKGYRLGTFTDAEKLGNKFCVII